MDSTERLRGTLVEAVNQIQGSYEVLTENKEDMVLVKFRDNGDCPSRHPYFLQYLSENGTGNISLYSRDMNLPSDAMINTIKQHLKLENPTYITGSRHYVWENISVEELI